MNAIKIEQNFDAPIHEVFELLSKHDTYNIAFAPIQVRRVKDATDPNRPDGLGSIRRMGFGPIKPIQEIITHMDVDQRIEYKLIKNPLIRHHLGIIQFESLSDQSTKVTYSIELESRIPFLSQMILAQLKVAIKLGFKKLAKSFKN